MTIENFGLEIKKEIQEFLKSSEIVSEYQSKIIIKESEKDSELNELNINLNLNGKFWLLKAENLKDKALAFEIKGKKVEAVLFHLDEDSVLNIILIEMKSKKCQVGNIKEKVINSITWLSYLLLLNDNKNNQSVKFHLLIADRNGECNYKSSYKNKFHILNSYEVPINVKYCLSKNENFTINLSDIYKRDYKC